MKSKKSQKGIYLLSCGRWLDRTAFLRYFEKKILYTIRKFELLNKEDKIIAALSGGKDSMTLLYILNKFCSPRGQKLMAMAVDEGIPGYRDKLLKEASKFCKEYEIPIKIYSFKKEFGFTLKNKTKSIGKLNLSNCYVCSILKRWLLNKKAQQLGYDVIATAHSLDDEAESILLNLFKGSPELLAKLGPATGITRAKKEKGKGKGFIQRIKPFYLCSTKEIVLYAQLNKIPVPKGKTICPLRGITFRVNIRNWLADLENKHPEIKNAIVKSFLKIMPMLKQKYKGLEFSKCRKCGFPASKEFCKPCQLLEKLK